VARRGQARSGPVSRILSGTAISLESRLPGSSSASPPYRISWRGQEAPPYISRGLETTRPTSGEARQRPTRGWRRATAYASYLALLRAGFAMPSVSPPRRCALTVPATRRKAAMNRRTPDRTTGIPTSRDTFSPLPCFAIRLRQGYGGQEATQGCVFSVALSVGLPLLGVTQRPALWSPDFPPFD